MKKMLAAFALVLFTCVVMAVSVIGPELLTKYRDKSMLGEIHTRTAAEGGEGYQYTLSPVEKLFILSSSLSAPSAAGEGTYTRTYSFVMNRMDQPEEELAKEQIYAACNENLAALKNLGVVPESVLDVDPTDYDAVLYSAIDVLEPRNYVGVWKISLSNNYENRNKENRLIDAYVDAETGKLYEFYVRTPVLWEDIEPDGLAAAWADYMELSAPIPYEDSNPLMESTPYFRKYRFPGTENEETIVTVGFYEGINELFLKISQSY